MYVYFETESTKIITAVFPALELLRRVYDTDAHYIGISLETIYGTPRCTDVESICTEILGAIRTRLIKDCILVQIS